MKCTNQPGPHCQECFETNLEARGECIPKLFEPGWFLADVRRAAKRMAELGIEAQKTPNAKRDKV